MKKTRGAVLVASTGLGLLAVTADPAFAHWLVTGVGAGKAVTGTVAAATSLTVPAMSGTDVPVSWMAPVAPGGGGTFRYYLTRTAGGTTTTAGGTCGSASAPIATTSCVDSAPGSGTYSYRVVALFNSWTATSGSSSAVTVSVATRLAFTSAALSGTASSNALLGPLTVRLQNSSGGAAAAAAATTVTLASTSAGGVFAATPGGAAITTVTIPAGGTSATFYYGDTKAGSPTVIASAASLTSAGQIETIAAGAAATVAAAAGSSQAATVGAAFGTALVARVLDSYGNAVAGATVTFKAPSSGASGVFANGTGTTTAVTDAGGQATAATFTANTAPGSYSVTAGTGSAAGATFSLTNTVGPAPTVSSVTPNFVSRRSSYTLTVTGTNFRAGATVAFSGPVPVTVTSVTVVSATQLTVQVTVPNNATTGNRSITVTNADGTSVAKGNAIVVTN